MKKIGIWVRILALIVLMLPQTIYAKQGSAVWSEEHMEENGMVVEVHSNGQVQDGYFEIQYDSAKFICDENVIFDDSIKVHSVNITDDTVNVAFASTDPIAEGILFCVKFYPASDEVEVADDMVMATFYGEANAIEGEPLKVVNTTEKKADEEDVIESNINEAVNENRTVNEKNLAVVLLGFGVVIVVGALLVRKKKEKEKKK